MSKFTEAKLEAAIIELLQPCCLNEEDTEEEEQEKEERERHMEKG